MRTFATTASLAAMIAVAGITAADPALAACTRLGFSVNDYGKDGPTKDAIKLLDGYIAKWAGERGIKSYRTGKKDVNCELFLNLIVFDEHTCRAEATVCWDGPPVSPQAAPAQSAGAAKPTGEAGAPRASSTVKRASIPAGTLRAAPARTAPVETVATPAPPPPAAPKAAAPAALPPAAPAPVQTAAPAAAPAPKPAVVETGAVPAAAKPVSPPADTARAAPPAAPAPSKSSAASDPATEQALQAAQRAAAAAERAAAAAERAAAAAAAAEKARQ